LKVASNIFVSAPARLFFMFLAIGILPSASAQDCRVAREHPTIIYQQKRLSIRANGCTLDEVLNAVRVITGISLDIPVSAKRELIFARLGPDRVVLVLTSLLRGIRFNYLIAGSDEDPSSIRLVMSEIRNNSGQEQSSSIRSSVRMNDASGNENSTEGVASVQTEGIGDPETRDLLLRQPLATHYGANSLVSPENGEVNPTSQTGGWTHRQERPRYFPPVKTQ
jgi:hypothetical protein